MGRIEIETEIEAPVEKVFAFYADVKNQEKLLPEDAEAKVEMLSEGPTGVGTTFTFSGIVGGRKIGGENEIFEFEENSRLGFRQTEGDMKRFESTTVFEAIDRGTKVTDTTEYELPYGVLGKLLDKLKAGKDIERYVKTGHERSKEILEKR